MYDGKGESTGDVDSDDFEYEDFAEMEALILPVTDFTQIMDRNMFNDED